MSDTDTMSALSESAYLVVESTLLVEVLEELHVGLAPPEVQVADLEVGPDWERRERREVSM